jgi:hypothetical protein
MLDRNAAQSAHFHGQRFVEDDCPQSGNSCRINSRGMDSPFISCRRSLADAAELIERFGDDAGFEAAVRAEESRDAGNVVRFCHWRQIERVIVTLASDEVRGTIH